MEVAAPDVEARRLDGLAWYIDAWAVYDGMAFASFRQPGRVDATNTIFMSVPDLEPIPVGRISTALSATNRGFQRGLGDSEGNEIAFGSLAEIRIMVERAYTMSES
ncbi:MAG: hypothetical protein ACXV8Y_07955, partial [Acidimicrobiia bacterium]